MHSFPHTYDDPRVLETRPNSFKREDCKAAKNTTGSRVEREKGAVEKMTGTEFVTVLLQKSI